MSNLITNIIKRTVWGASERGEGVAAQLPERMQIEPIGPVWTPFGDAGDMAILLPPCPRSPLSDETGVLYLAQAGSLFPVHIHDRTEKGYVKGGPIVVRDEHGTRIMSLVDGDTFTFGASAPHEFHFHGASEIYLRYFPAFELDEQGRALWTAYRVKPSRPRG